MTAEARYFPNAFFAYAHRFSHKTHAIIYHTYRQMILLIHQTNKKNLRGDSGAVSHHSLSSLLLRIHTSLTGSAAHRRVSSCDRAPSEFCLASVLVLPLGLLGDHLLHAERGQPDAEGGQQRSRSDRILSGGLAAGSGVGEFIHLSVI